MESWLVREEGIKNENGQRNEKFVIDSFLVNESKRNELDKKVKRGAEIGSDHYVLTPRLK